MKRISLTRRGLTLAGPLFLVIVPKCPLCLLPVFAMAGMAAPARPVLHAIVVAVVLVWVVLLMRRAKSRAVRTGALLAATLVIAGRVVPFMPAMWIGVAIMAAIGIRQLASREPVCSSGCVSQ